MTTVTARHHIKAEEAALERPVKEHRLARLFKTHLLWELTVRSEHPSGPPSKMRFEVVGHILHHGTNRGALGVGLFPIRRIRNQNPAFGTFWRQDFTGIVLREAEAAISEKRLESSAFCVFHGLFNEEISLA